MTSPSPLFGWALSLIASLPFFVFAASPRVEQPRLVGTLGVYSQVWIAPLPGGRHVLVAADSLLLRFDRQTGQTQTISRGSFRNLSLSADGRHLAFDRSTRVWVARFDPTTWIVDSLRQLVADPSYRPLMAPDGNSVAFSHPAAGGEALAIASREGGSRQLLPVGGATVAAVGWSPDGGSLYYTTPEPRFSRSYSIRRLMLSDRSDSVVIARNFLQNARLSPDGRFLLFKSSSRQLAVASSNGTGAKTLDAVERPDLSYGTPQWVPGETELMFAVFTERRSIWKVSTADARSERWAVQQPWAAWSAISPREQLAAMIVSNGRPAILIQALSNAAQRIIEVSNELTTGPDGPRLTWSPDGVTLAVTTGNLERPAHPNPTGIQLIDGNTGRVYALPTAHELQRFAWSRDSRSIRYVHQPDGSNEKNQRPEEIRETQAGGPDRLVRALHAGLGAASFVDFDHVYSWNDAVVTDLATGRRHAVLDSASIPQFRAGPFRGFPTNPYISPDGQWLVAAAGSSSDGLLNRIAIVAMASGTRRLLDAGMTHTGDLAASWQADSKHVVVTGRDSTGTTRAVLLAIDNGQGRTIGTLDSDRAGVVFAQSPNGVWLAVSRREEDLPVGLLSLRVGY